MESHSSEVQELSPPTPPPLNTIQEPLTASRGNKELPQGMPWVPPASPTSISSSSGLSASLPVNLCLSFFISSVSYVVFISLSGGHISTYVFG